MTATRTNDANNPQNPNHSTPPARYIMIGGFLGAGKSTTMVRLAAWLTGKGYSVGLITNDQSVGLVDTRMMQDQDLEVEEIPGGCFCCRFDSLLEATEKLSLDERPDIFLAEPVGSCTDLVASVSYPLRRMYGDRFKIAPFSVLLDPNRALQILGLKSGKSFSEKVRYVYQKQMEEAQQLVINKKDLLDEADLKRLVDHLEAKYPEKEIRLVSARHGEDLEPWFESLLESEMHGGESMALDYDIYADGEALLGWLNATYELRADEAVNGEAFMMDIATLVHEKLNGHDAEVAHFKMTLSRKGGHEETAILNLVNNEYVPELAQSLYDTIDHGELIVNLRAEAHPDLLTSILADAVEQVLNSEKAKAASLALTNKHQDAFKPAKPTPTHRDNVAV